MQGAPNDPDEYLTFPKGSVRPTDRPRRIIGEYAPLGKPERNIIDKLTKIQANLNAAQRLIYEGENEAALRAANRAYTVLNKVRLQIKARIDGTSLQDEPNKT